MSVFQSNRNINKGDLIKLTSSVQKRDHQQMKRKPTDQEKTFGNNNQQGINIQNT